MSHCYHVPVREELRGEDMIELSTELQDLLRKRVVCFFATIMPDGLDPTRLPQRVS